MIAIEPEHATLICGILLLACLCRMLGVFWERLAGLKWDYFSTSLWNDMDLCSCCGAQYAFLRRLRLRQWLPAPQQASDESCRRYQKG